MKAISIIFCLLSAINVSAQKLEQYCKIMVRDRYLSNKVSIEIEYGSEIKKHFSFKDTRLTDSLGSPILFNSDIDAINYMSLDGWKLMFGLSIPVDNRGSHIQYFMKREYEVDEKIKN